MNDFKPHDYVPDLQAMGDCRICGAADERACLRLNLSAATKRAGEADAQHRSSKIAWEVVEANLRSLLCAAEHRAATAEQELLDQCHPESGSLTRQVFEATERAATAEARVKALGHVNKAAAKAHEAALDDAHSFRCALQEALAREAGKDAAFQQIMKLRHHTIDGRAVFDADEVEAIARKAVSDESLQEMRSTTSPHPEDEGEVLGAAFAAQTAANTRRAPHPWGEVVRAAMSTGAKYKCHFRGHAADIFAYEDYGELAKAVAALSALPASAAPSDTAALIEAGRLAVAKHKAEANWNEVQGGDWGNLMEFASASLRATDDALGKAWAAIIEKEKGDVESN